jgi:hypothetical protein
MKGDAMNTRSWVWVRAGASLCGAWLCTASLATATPTRTATATGKSAAPLAAKTVVAPAGRDTTASDGGMTLKGGTEGTVFKSLTVEGEDRVHLEFDRPELDLALDPSQAPGLDWGTARDVLDRTLPDAMAPLMQTTARQPMPYLARPWLAAFGSGTVASFHPDVAGVERWKLTIADSHGRVVQSFSGRGAPPRDLAWDGRASDGSPVTPGLTYSYVFEAYDRAGNKRNIVGKGFTVSAYRFGTPDGPVLTFCGDSLWSGSTTSMMGARSEAGHAPELLLEAASWLNQSDRVTQPIRVTATARSRDQAEGLATTVLQGLSPLVLNGPARLKAVTVIQPDAPGGGTVTITPGR